MTTQNNLRKYGNEILDICVISNQGLAVDKQTGEPKPCSLNFCGNCIFQDTATPVCIKSKESVKRWLYDPVRPVLTYEEIQFLKNFKGDYYIAKDANQVAGVYIYTKEPYFNDELNIFNVDSNANCIEISKFVNLKFQGLEKGECYKIKCLV